MRSKFRSWVEISRENLYSNLGQFRKIIGPKVKILAIVKSNAYGHGFKEIISLLEGKVDFFGVADIDEGLRVRELGSRIPVVVLGYVPTERLHEAAESDISVAFYNEEVFREIRKTDFSRPLKIHLKIETGMNRQGVGQESLMKFIDFIKAEKKKIILEGVYSHFADTTNPKFMEGQFEKFSEAIKILKKNGLGNFTVHLAASIGTLTAKEYHLDMVRGGIGLYGYASDFKPVLTWKSVVGQVKDIGVGEFVGYGRSWQAQRKTKIAIIPVGYYDGMDRGFSNNGRVLINGEVAKIIGRVSMNMLTVDVTEIKDVKSGGEVVLLGRQGEKRIDANDLAEAIGTIDHEILARINPLIKRVVV